MPSFATQNKCYYPAKTIKTDSLIFSRLFVNKTNYFKLIFNHLKPYFSIIKLFVG